MEQRYVIDESVQHGHVRDRDAATFLPFRSKLPGRPRERAIENAEFQTGSVYELPFEDASFDVVYANAVLFYLREPERALAEMRRVLRPGGLAAVSDDDLGTIVTSPESAPWSSRRHCSSDR